MSPRASSTTAGPAVTRANSSRKGSWRVAKARSTSIPSPAASPATSAARKTPMFTRRDFLASTLAVAPASLHARFAAADDPPVTGVANPALAPFDNLLTKFVKDNALPGAGVAVTRNGKLVYARGFGYDDIENKKPVEPAAMFRIASISKPFTAVGVLHL